MIIESVEAEWLHVPTPENSQHVSDFGRHTSFDTAVVKIRTRSGLVGWGEAKAAVGGTGVYRALVGVIRDELAPQIIGEDARHPARIWEKLYSGTRAGYAEKTGRVFPQLGRRGLTICGMSGIDIALWDLLGKSLELPVWQLLGGRVHDWLPAYASGGWAPAGGIGEQLHSYIDQGGFGAVKMRVGAGDGSLRHSVERVREARQVLGEEVGIMVDAHGTMSLTEAKRFARQVEECDLSWFEEPVTADCQAQCAELRQVTDIPIAAGESLFTRFDFRDAIEDRSVDVLQPDTAIAGGITETMRIGTLAATHQLGLAPHLWGGAIMFAAGLHVAMASPSAFILEYSLAHNPMQHELVGDMFPIVEGGMAAPEKAGLGVTVDEEFVKRYTVS